MIDFECPVCGDTECMDDHDELKLGPHPGLRQVRVVRRSDARRHDNDALDPDLGRNDAQRTREVPEELDMHTIMLAMAAGALADALANLIWTAKGGHQPEFIPAGSAAIRVLTYGGFGLFLLYVALRWN